MHSPDAVPSCEARKIGSVCWVVGGEPRTEDAPVQSRTAERNKGDELGLCVCIGGIHLQCLDFLVQLHMNINIR